MREGHGRQNRRVPVQGGALRMRRRATVRTAVSLSGLPAAERRAPRRGSAHAVGPVPHHARLPQELHRQGRTRATRSRASSVASAARRSTCRSRPGPTSSASGSARSTMRAGSGPTRTSSSRVRSRGTTWTRPCRPSRPIRRESRIERTRPRRLPCALPLASPCWRTAHETYEACKPAARTTCAPKPAAEQFDCLSTAGRTCVRTHSAQKEPCRENFTTCYAACGPRPATQVDFWCTLDADAATGPAHPLWRRRDGGAAFRGPRSGVEGRAGWF